MKHLSEKFIREIKDYIKKCNVDSTELEENLIGHFIYFVESEMNKGLSFDDALYMAKDQIFPNEVGTGKKLLLSRKRVRVLKIWLLLSVAISCGLFYL